MTTATDWVSDMFPGEGLELPSDEERDKADALLAEWAARWREEPVTVPRTRPVSVSRWVDGQAGSNTYQVPTNRAFMRSKVRRWWAKR